MMGAFKTIDEFEKVENNPYSDYPTLLHAFTADNIIDKGASGLYIIDSVSDVELGITGAIEIEKDISYDINSAFNGTVINSFKSIANKDLLMVVLSDFGTIGSQIVLGGSTSTQLSIASTSGTALVGTFAANGTVTGITFSANREIHALLYRRGAEVSLKRGLQDYTYDADNGTKDITAIPASLADLPNFHTMLNARKWGATMLFAFDNAPSDSDIQKALQWMQAKWLVGDFIVSPILKGAV